MTRPSAPIELVKGHRTKAEIETRKEAEKALLTGTPLKEWTDIKNNKVAHKEFVRIKKLLQAIGKDDALHESVINRYCLMLAECKEFEEMKATMFLEIDEVKRAYAAQELKIEDYLYNKSLLQDRIMTCDKQVQAKRKMLLDIEKENIMTIASALRSIPKKPEEKEKSSGVAAFMKKRG